MRKATQGALLVLALAGAGTAAFADPDRSAAMVQLTPGATMAERSSAAVGQISTVENGRSRLDQIDPSIAASRESNSDVIEAETSRATPPSCVLDPEQQAIVTSLTAQGKLPAGDCEMLAWFAEPRDKDEITGRQSIAEAVVTTAPELVGRDGEADRLARLEEEQRRADALAAAAALSLLAPPPPPGQ